MPQLLKKKSQVKKSGKHQRIKYFINVLEMPISSVI